MQNRHFRPLDRKKIKKLLKQFRIFTPDAMLRWRIVDMLAKLLLEKRNREIAYDLAYIRNRDLVRKIRKPTSVGNVVRMLIRSKPKQILVALDEKEAPPQIHFTKNG